MENVRMVWPGTTATATYVFGQTQWDALTQAMDSTITEVLADHCVQRVVGR